MENEPGLKSGHFLGKPLRVMSWLLNESKALGYDVWWPHLDNAYATGNELEELELHAAQIIGRQLHRLLGFVGRVQPSSDGRHS